MAWNHTVEIELQRGVERLGPFLAAATACIVDQLRRGVAEGEHVSRRQRAIGRKYDHHVAVGVGAPEVVQLHVFAAQVDVRVMLDHDARQTRLLTVHHVLASFFGCDHHGVQVLHLRVAAAVVAMMMRIDDVLDRLVGDLLQLLQDAVVIDIELIVHQKHAFAGNQGRGIARNNVVVDHIEIVFDFDEIQFRRRRPLSVGHPQAGQRAAPPRING